MRKSALLLAAACACSGPQPAGPGLPGGPIPPPAGRPTGRSGSLSIGSSGGTLPFIASDGSSLTLSVPPGALSAAVEFTIEEITTTALAAVGSAFRILPGSPALIAAATLVFTPGVAAGGLTAARQDATGYWFRVYASRADATTVTVSTGVLGDWSVVTVATQRDLQGPFSLTNDQGVPYTATGSVTLQFLGDDGTEALYLPQGTITPAAPISRGAATCTADGSTALPPSIAEIRWAAPTQFRWGLNGQWNLSCSDGSTDFISTNFDSLGITNIGCARAYLGAYTIDGSHLQGTYRIDCGARGTVTATWDLTPPP